MRFVALLLSGAVLAAAPRPRLQLKIDEVISRSPAVAAAFVGMRVVSLRDGRVLYQRDQDHLFAPASNTKLFTTALALNILGPDYRFITRIFATQPIDGSGRVAGDLVLVGSGDPGMSNRAYPYQRPEPGAKPQPFETVGPIETLADQLVARGLRSVDGNIVGDDRRYLFEPYPEGWSADDAVWEYGAPVSALVVNDNAFTLWIKPGERPGDLARLDTSPSMVPFSINNRVITTGAGERKIYEDRQIRAQELHVWGEIPVSDSGTSDLLAVDDPAVFAAAMLRDALVRRGVSIRGSPLAAHLFPNQVYDPKRGSGAPAPGGVEVAQRTSAPLLQLLQVIDKVSQNLHAEVMLREIGAVRRGIGSREAGQEEMKTFLAEIGISAGEYHLVDGSGLSRLTLVTPAAITKLLVYMYRSRYRDQWIALLPIAGFDGTLSKRFENHPEARRIQAKTGSLSHVRAMSGYAESEEYGPLAFSVVVNDSLASSHDISAFLDTIGLKLIR